MPTFLRFPKTWLGVNKPLWTRKERICKRNWKFVISHPKRLLEVSNLKKKKRAVCLNPLILLTSFDEFLSTFCDAGITIHSVNRRDWVIKSNDDSLEKNGKLIPRSIYVYIYIFKTTNGQDTIQNPPVISTRKRSIAPRVTTRSTIRSSRPPPSVRGIHLDGTRLDPDPREEHSSSLIRCNWQALRPWNLPF